MLSRVGRTLPLIYARQVQRLSEFDAAGRSLKEEWQTLIDDATKRLGTADDHRCRVTVTDRFGGRGHDFRVVDKEANANGGMLVIATSIPDEREWIQWKGRTARQDRPGQFHVVLNTKAKPFDGNKELVKKVRGATIKEGELKGEPDHDLRAEPLVEYSHGLERAPGNGLPCPPARLLARPHSGPEGSSRTPACTPACTP